MRDRTACGKGHIPVSIWGFTRCGGVFALSAAALLAEPPPLIGPQVRIDVGGGTFAANEITIAANPANPFEVIAGWNDWRRSGQYEVINAAFALSSDGGNTWTDFLLRPPLEHQSNVEGDPMTAIDPRTGTMWAGAISFAAALDSGIYVARKPLGATEFEPAIMARTGVGMDKCWMAAGPAPGAETTTRLYITYNMGVISSEDMGDTWSEPVSLGAGSGFLPRIGRDGVLYVSYWDYGTGMMLKRSLDGGRTFSTHTVATRMDVWPVYDGSRFPGTFRVPPWLYLATDTVRGTIYGVYFDTTDTHGGDANVDVYLTKSYNRGETWSIPRVINSDADPPGDQFFSWIEVNESGRLHLIYLDSRHTVQNDDSENGMFDAYHAYSDDEGVSWTEQRLTPTAWNSNDDGLNRPSQFIGDYLGVAVAGGRTYPVYIDTTEGDPNIFTNVIAPPDPADFDEDGDVDLIDFYQLFDCTTGPDLPPSSLLCRVADLDGDEDVDLIDVGEFQRRFTGGF